MTTLHRSFTVALCLTTAVLLLCTFGPDTEGPLTMRRVDGQGDTLSVFPTLRFSFSQPVANENVSLYLEPEGGRYYSVLNETKDTLELVVSGLLEGNTRYAVGPAQTVTATTGSSIGAGGVEFFFVTRAREREPNDVRDTSARFVDPIYGDIYTPQDTDYFCVTVPVSGFHLVSHDEGVVLQLGLVDSSGRDTATTGNLAETYLGVPDSFSLPLFVRVTSLN
jgi:hypothetical protein